ncbi:hypothetical protein ACTGJ9_039575, partial [Bradyrhizobium sp. RDM12]
DRHALAVDGRCTIVEPVGVEYLQVDESERGKASVERWVLWDEQKKPWPRVCPLERGSVQPHRHDTDIGCEAADAPSDNPD